ADISAVSIVQPGPEEVFYLLAFGRRAAPLLLLAHCGHQEGAYLVPRPSIKRLALAPPVAITNMHDGNPSAVLALANTTFAMSASSRRHQASPSGAADDVLSAGSKACRTSSRAPSL